MSVAYRLPDEPLPSGLSKHAVDPLWPFLALMLGGNALGLAWFAFNSFALGSPTRKLEILWVLCSFIGSILIVLALQSAEARGWLQGVELRYAGLSLPVLHLAFGYLLNVSQARCFEIWEYYGGKARSGLVVFLLIALLGSRLLDGGADQLPGWLAGALR